MGFRVSGLTVFPILPDEGMSGLEFSKKVSRTRREPAGATPITPAVLGGQVLSLGGA